jgi:serine/threonine protein kinase
LDLSLDGYLAARGPLPIVEAVDLALAMCDRVTPLHSGNSPYRELSIDAFWVMRTPEGGIALDCERPLATLHSSPRFEAPELRSAPDRVDHRADIWSLGAILYELLVGYGPEGDLRSRATLSLAPRTLSALLEARRFLPSALAETVYACLEEQPWRRPQTISDLTALLMPFSSRRERHSRSAQDSESIASTWLGHPAPHLAAVLLLGAASPAAPKPVTTPDDKSKSTRPTIPPPSRARSVQARTPTLYTLAPGASAPWLPPALVVDAPAEEFVRLRRRASVYSTQHLAIRARVADGSAGSVPSDPRSSYAQVPAVESRPPKGTNAQLDHAPWFWAVAIAVSIGAAVATALAAQALESGNGSGLVHSHR